MPDSPAQQPAAPPAWTRFDVQWRIAVAFATGLLLHAVFVFQFQPYSHRADSTHSLVSLVAGLALAGFLLAWRAPDAAVAFVPLALTLGLLGGNTALIIVDCVKDPTAHNLWPFEMVMLLVISIAAGLGAVVARKVG